MAKFEALNFQLICPLHKHIRYSKHVCALTNEPMKCFKHSDTIITITYMYRLEISPNGRFLQIQYMSTTTTTDSAESCLSTTNKPYRLHECC